MTNQLPRALYCAAQVRELDRLVMEELGIDDFELMQRAGSAVLSRLREYWPRARSLIVFVGAGNNGGDGHVIAALAAAQGLAAQIVYPSAPGNPVGAAAQAKAMAVERNVHMCSLAQLRSRRWQDFDIVVDALLGTGLNRDISEEWLEAIDWINGAGRPVVAVDIPSGLHADTGTPMGGVVRADLTVTFIGLKRGLFTHQGPDFAGELVFESLAAPPRHRPGKALPAAAVTRVDIDFCGRLLPRRRASAHKGSNGHVLLLGGDYGTGGAVILAAEAALRGGAGLVTVVTRSAHRPALLARRPEVMVVGTEDERVDLPALFDRASNIVIGPGLGRGEWSINLLRAALTAHSARDIPLLMDADALRLLAARAVAGIELPGKNWILTPHPGEAAALLETDIASVQRDRFAAVAELQRRYGGCCLLKGVGSLICEPGGAGRLKLCSEGNPSMAAGGMGDALCGIIAALHAQGLSLERSLCCAVCVHGEAADLAVAGGAERGLVAADLMPFIRQLVNPCRAPDWKTADNPGG